MHVRRAIHVTLAALASEGCQCDPGYQSFDIDGDVVAELREWLGTEDLPASPTEYDCALVCGNTLRIDDSRMDVYTLSSCTLDLDEAAIASTDPADDGSVGGQVACTGEATTNPCEGRRPLGGRSATTPCGERLGVALAMMAHLEAASVHSRPGSDVSTRTESSRTPTTTPTVSSSRRRSPAARPWGSGRDVARGGSMRLPDGSPHDAPPTATSTSMPPFGSHPTTGRRSSASADTSPGLRSLTTGSPRCRTAVSTCCGSSGPGPMAPRVWCSLPTSSWDDWLRSSATEEEPHVLPRGARPGGARTPGHRPRGARARATSARAARGAPDREHPDDLDPLGRPALRVFGVDGLACPVCSHKMYVHAVISGVWATRRVLACLARPSTTPRLWPAPAPPAAP